MDNDHFVITHCKTLSDLNVALGHIYSLPEDDFSLFLVAVGREDLLQEAVQTDLAAVTCSSEKFYLKLLDCPVHICVKQMLFRTSRSCLTMLELMPACQYILSCGEKALFMRLELS